MLRQAGFRAFHFTGLLTLVCLGLATPGLGQNPAWYANHDQGSRYEGLVDRPNAHPDYEILGLFAYRLPDDRLPDRLQLTYYVPAGNSVDSVVVKEIQLDTQYLMKAKPDKTPSVQQAWNTFNDWPTSTVIRPAHVQLDNLGVLIRLKGGPIPGLLSPAVFYGTNAPQTIDSYSLDFVSGRTLKSFSCVASDSKGTRVDCSGGRRSLESSMPATLHISAKALSAGPVTVTLNGDYLNSTGQSLNAKVHFFHQPLTAKPR